MGWRTTCLLNSHLLQYPLGIMHQRRFQNGNAMWPLQWCLSSQKDLNHDMRKCELLLLSGVRLVAQCSQIKCQHCKISSCLSKYQNFQNICIPKLQAVSFARSLMLSAQLQSHQLLFHFSYSVLLCLWYENLTTLETELQ